MKLVVTGLAVAALAACGDASPSASASASPRSATAAPTATGPVLPTGALIGCPRAAQSSTSGIVGIGGTVGAFAAVHKQSPSSTAQFADSTRPDAFFAACKPGADVIGSIDHSLPADDSGPPAEETEDQALAEARAAQLFPADATVVSATTPGACKLITMHSAALGATQYGVAFGGTFVIELNRPAHDAGPYDPAKVADTLVTTLPTTTC